LSANIIAEHLNAQVDDESCQQMNDAKQIELNFLRLPYNSEFLQQRAMYLSWQATGSPSHIGGWWGHKNYLLGQFESNAALPQMW
jgi:hypothetical protein